MARRADKAERPACRVILLAAQGELRPKVGHTFSWFSDLWLITARDPYIKFRRGFKKPKIIILLNFPEGFRLIQWHGAENEGDQGPPDEAENNHK